MSQVFSRPEIARAIEEDGGYVCANFAQNLLAALMHDLCLQNKTISPDGPRTTFVIDNIQVAAYDAKYETIIIELGPVLFKTGYGKLVGVITSGVNAGLVIAPRWFIEDPDPNRMRYWHQEPIVERLSRCGIFPGEAQLQRYLRRTPLQVQRTMPIQNHIDVLPYQPTGNSGRLFKWNRPIYPLYESYPKSWEVSANVINELSRAWLELATIFNNQSPAIYMQLVDSLLDQLEIPHDPVTTWHHVQT